jgi:hypothetical protein
VNGPRYFPCAFLPGNKPPVAAERRVFGPQRLSGSFAKEKNLFALARKKLQFLCCPTHNLFNILTVLSWL